MLDSLSANDRLPPNPIEYSLGTVMVMAIAVIVLLGLVIAIGCNLLERYKKE